MHSEIVTIGFDDIDSPKGGCTTHFTSLIIEKLGDLVEKWIDYPRLIRLNPNIPFRTRGNGATCLKFQADSVAVDEIISIISSQVYEYAEAEYSNTNPGAIIATGEIPKAFRQFALKATWRALPISLAERALDRHKVHILREGTGRGVIGALAAIGNDLAEDHTYEYIAYRKLSDCDKPRGVDPQSVEEMDSVTKPHTFSNIDLHENSILIEPQGPDPVLFGIRGETPDDVVRAASIIKSEQSIDRWVVFRSNQGTAEHLKHTLSINQLRPYMAARVRGRVVSQPHVREGGHVFFKLGDATATIDCAAYEPTGVFRWDVMKLKIGDEIIIDAGVRPASKMHGPTLNIEGMNVIKLAEDTYELNPLCSECGKRMKSAGRNKGFKCVHCGHRDRDSRKMILRKLRELREGIYLPQPKAQRHLTRPVSRFGRKNIPPNGLIGKWHFP